MEIKFCSRCGGIMKQGVPDDDDHMRAICTQCDFIHYLNPKMVVGCIPQWGDQVLMCRRNIEPGKGKWTLPAGYLENGETVEEGAARETLEETRARVKITDPCRLFNIPHVNQMYLMFRAELLSKEFGPTSESTHVNLFSKENIPWDDIAFSVIRKTLEDFFKDKKHLPGSFEIKTILPV